MGLQKESEMTGQVNNNNHEIHTKYTKIQTYSCDDQYCSKLSRSFLKLKKIKENEKKKTKIFRTMINKT